MSKVSVLIPSRLGTNKEAYLWNTVDDLFDNAAGEIEVIVIVDGDPPKKRPRRKGLKVRCNKTVKGNRYNVNKAASLATGKYIMALDDHCTVGEGWDEILQADCKDTWVIVPRRYWFDAPTWSIKDQPHVDAMYYCYPFARPYKPRLTCRPWPERAEGYKDKQIVEDMGFQGSCYFMTKEHFTDRLGGLNEHGYGTFAHDAQEIGLKTWLGPWNGKVIRNKNTFYAHWSKPGTHWSGDPEVAGRTPDAEREAGYIYCFDYWYHNRWGDRAHDFDWLIDKFGQLPNWPENWQGMESQYTRYPMYSGYATYKPGSATGDVAGNVPYREAVRKERERQLA